MKQDLFFRVDSKCFDISSLLCVKKLPKFPKDYIFNIENYLKDINHFEYFKKYLNNKQIEYLKKYSYEFDLYFLLKDLRILKNPNYILHRVNIEKAKNQCEIMGLLCGYWQEYITENFKYFISDHHSYYDLAEGTIRGHFYYSSFSFTNEVKLNELFKMFLNIGKKIANKEMSFQDVINSYSEIMKLLEKRCNELITKIKKYEILYNFRGDDTKWNLTA